MQYSVASYTDLVSILEKNWYIRGLNEAGDCCYVILEMVCFLARFFPDGNRVCSRFRQ